MGKVSNNSASSDNQPSAEVILGRKLRELRNQRGLSLRELSERSGLNINTLSLVENGKSSPSVGTLQQLAQALDTPIATFFETEPLEKKVVFTPAEQRPQVSFGTTLMQNLAQDLAGRVVEPFMVSLEPGAGSGKRMVVHTGHEFIYCLKGSLLYQIEEENYQLTPGDTLVFESHLPHCWQNNGDDTAEILLILYPYDGREEPGGRHFPL
jgi:transcriptional regulator with XRE-family HTH domain